MNHRRRNFFRQLTLTKQGFYSQYLPRRSSFSSNTIFNSGFLIFNCRAVAQPTIPPPTTATSNSDVLKKQSSILTNKHGRNWKAKLLSLQNPSFRLISKGHCLLSQNYKPSTSSWRNIFASRKDAGPKIRWYPRNLS